MQALNYRLGNTRVLNTQGRLPPGYTVLEQFYDDAGNRVYLPLSELAIMLNQKSTSELKKLLKSATGLDNDWIDNLSRQDMINSLYKIGTLIERPTDIRMEQRYRNMLDDLNYKRNSSSSLTNSSKNSTKKMVLDSLGSPKYEKINNKMVFGLLEKPKPKPKKRSSSSSTKSRKRRLSSFKSNRKRSINLRKIQSEPSERRKASMRRKISSRKKSSSWSDSSSDF